VMPAPFSLTVALICQGHWHALRQCIRELTRLFSYG